MIEEVQEGVGNYNYYFFKDFGLTNKDETHGALGDWMYSDTVIIADQTIISLHDKSNTDNFGDMDGYANSITIK